MLPLFIDIVQNDSLLTGGQVTQMFDAERHVLDAKPHGAVSEIDPVLAWNQAVLETIRLDASAPPVATRAMAMTSIAMLDVVNAVEGTASYLVSLAPPAGISIQAAVSAAALRVMGHLYPGQTAALPATAVPAQDGSFAWLFFHNPMPGGRTISVHLDGETILASDGTKLDADGNGVAGGAGVYRFTTVSLAGLAGTSLTGRVVGPGPDLKPMTFDDIRAGADGIPHTGDDVFLKPIAGAKVFILGLEDQFVLTDAEGFFTLSAVPSGNVKLAIDGDRRDGDGFGGRKERHDRPRHRHYKTGLAWADAAGRYGARRYSPRSQ